MTKTYKIVCVVAVDSNGDVASGASSANDFTTALLEAKQKAVENYDCEIGEDLPRRYVTVVMDVPAPVDDTVTVEFAIPEQEANQPIGLRIV